MNDVGRFGTADGTILSGSLEYQETVPGRLFRSYSLGVETQHEWNFGGDGQNAQFGPRFSAEFGNFWETRGGVEFSQAVQDERLTRGGPSMQRPRSWRADVEFESSDANETQLESSIEYARDALGGLEFGVETELRLQPSPQWQLTIGPQYERGLDPQQYVTTLGGGTAATYGSRYVFARVDRSTYSMQARLSYTFKPDLTLDFYGEPFAASGRYANFGELAAARTSLTRTYGTAGTTLTTLPDGSALVTDGDATFGLQNRDFNVQSFRSNLVLRWEWRAGSLFYLVWQQDREREETLGTRVSVGDMFSSIGRRGDNFFAIKASFWMSPR
jgi:hypothetical protein